MEMNPLIHNTGLLGTRAQLRHALAVWDNDDFIISHMFFFRSFCPAISLLDSDRIILATLAHRSVCNWAISVQ